MSWGTARKTPQQEQSEVRSVKAVARSVCKVSPARPQVSVSCPLLPAQLLLGSSSAFWEATASLLFHAGRIKPSYVAKWCRAAEPPVHAHPGHALRVVAPRLPQQAALHFVSQAAQQLMSILLLEPPEAPIEAQQVVVQLLWLELPSVAV